MQRDASCLDASELVQTQAQVFLAHLNPNYPNLAGCQSADGILAPKVRNLQVGVQKPVKENFLKHPWCYSLLLSETHLYCLFFNLLFILCFTIEHMFAIVFSKIHDLNIVHQSQCAFLAQNTPYSNTFLMFGVSVSTDNTEKYVLAK